MDRRVQHSPGLKRPECKLNRVCLRDRPAATGDLSQARLPFNVRHDWRKNKKKAGALQGGRQRASEWTDESPAVLVCGSQLCSTVGLFGALIQNIAADRAQAQTLLSSFTPAALPAAE